MDQNETFGSFFKENKSLLKEYLETRLEIFRLNAIRMASHSAGVLAWLIISIFLIFLIVLFAGLTLGFWLSKLTGSHVMGFGLVSILFVVVFVVFTLLRKKLFLEPIMQMILDRASEEIEIED